MAGDWIKMRASLVTSPKVNGIARILEGSREASRALSTGFSGTMSEIVTRNVMRHVTVSSLLIVWGAANEHTKDGIFKGADLSDIDDMVGIPGFGEAMASVGWAVYDEDLNAVTLPNFNEYNTSGASRSAGAKTAAERQADYRSRKKQAASVTESDVTRDVTSNHREEKRREEKSTTDVVDKRDQKSRVASRPDEVDETVWNDFLAMRKVKGAPVTETALSGLEHEAKKAGLRLAEALAMCCARGWRGFKAEWVAQERQNAQQAETPYQRSMRERWEEATGRRSDGRAVIDITPTQELLP